MATLETSVRPTQRMETRAVRGALWLFGDQIGGRLADMLFTVFLARLLLPGDFGLMALAATSTAFLRLFANMGLGAAIVQRQVVDDEDLSTAFWANMIFGIILFALAAAADEFLGAALREPRVGILVLFLASRFIIAAGSATQVAMISRRMDFRTLSLRSMVATVAAGFVGVGMALGGLGVWSLVGQAVSRVTVSTILLYRATGWRPRLYFSWARFRSLWAFGGPLLLSRIFSYLVRHSDRLLIGRYVGAVSLGFYSIAFAMFAAPLNDLGSVVHRVMFSALSRVQEDEGRFKHAFLLATRYLTLITLPTMIGMAVVAPLLIEILFGARWSPAAPVVTILALGAPVGLIMTMGPSGMQAGGRADLRMWQSLISVFVYVPAFAIGVRWGIVGVAVSSVVGSLILAPVEFRFLSMVTGVRFRELWRAVAPGMTGSLLMAVVLVPARLLVMTTELPNLLALALLVALGGLVYGLAIWMMHRQVVMGLVGLLRQSLLARTDHPLVEPD